MLIKNNNNYYEYLSISIITLIIFYFFIGKNTGSIAQGDPSNYQLFSRYYFDKYIFSWTFNDLGNSNFRYVLIPFYTISKILSFIIVDDEFLNKTLLYLFQYLLPALSINFFLKKITKIYFPYRLIGSFFYIYSINSSIYYFMDIYNPCFIFLPLSLSWFLFSLLKFNEKFQKRVFYILLSSIFAFLSQSSIGHIAFINFFILSFLISTLTITFIKPKFTKLPKFYHLKILLLIIIFLLSSLIINFNWIFIDFFKYFTLLGDYQEAGTFSLMPTQSLSDTFRLITFWAWRQAPTIDEFGDLYFYYPASIFYDNFIVILLNIFIIFISFFYFIKKSNTTSIKFILILYIVILMFLMTGKNFPGSIINNFLSDNLYFSLFRDRGKFSLDLTFLYSLLISLGLWKFNIFLKQNFSIRLLYFNYIFFIITIAYLLPGITAMQLNHKPVHPFKGWYYEIPDYYNSIEKYAETELKNSDHILILPFHSYGIPNLWTGSSGLVDYVPKSILNNQIITTLSNSFNKEKYGYFFTTDNSIKFNKLKQYGINHILLIRDKDCLTFCSNDILQDHRFFDQILINNPEKFTLIKNFGYFDEKYFQEIFLNNKNSKYKFQDLKNQYALSLYKINNNSELVEYYDHSNIKLDYEKYNNSIITINDKKLIDSKILLKTNYNQNWALYEFKKDFPRLNIFHKIFLVLNSKEEINGLKNNEFGIIFDLNRSTKNNLYLINSVDYLYYFLSIISFIWIFLIMIYGIYIKKNDN